LRRELLIYGVDVIVIQPGSIDTPIWDKAAPLRTRFEGTDYHPVLKRMNLSDERHTALPVSAVTRRIVDALVLPRPKTRYVIPDRLFRFWLLPRWLPDRWVDRAIDRVLKFQKVRDDIERR
jgi:short-subunit dehydrogenase